MITIWKYPLIGIVHRINIPKDAKILKLDMQGDNDVCIWAMVDTDKELVERVFFSFGTGQEIRKDEAKKNVYIGTVQWSGIVQHVFECF